MQADSLIRMANQIGSFFAAMPDREEAVADIAQHLKKFWEPRMRRALLAHVDEHGADERDDGLSEIVAEAVKTHREMLS
ncbi:formate dehydrogenase subunit delta [soil metagenome]